MQRSGEHCLDAAAEVLEVALEVAVAVVAEPEVAAVAVVVVVEREVPPRKC